MSNDLFPSGPWVGFYNYDPKDKHGMELNLTFAGGKVSGLGKDGLGPFEIHGGYDANTLECYWIKTYVGAHGEFYRGFREGKGIWGAWDIGPHSHGGFHIWPRQAGLGGEKDEVAETKQTAEAISGEIILRRVGDEP